MRSRLFAGALAATMICTVASNADPETRLKRDEFSFNLPDLNGEMVSSEDERFEGKVILLDIWGTWCINCRAAIPTLNALHEQFKDEGLAIVGVNFEHEKDKTKRIARAQKGVEKLGIEYLILDGGTPDDLFDSLPDLGEIEDIPTVILSGRDGKVRFVKTGFGECDAEIYKSEVAKALSTNETD